MKKAKKPTKTELSKQLGISRATLHTWETQGAPVGKGEEAIVRWAFNEGKGNRDDEAMRQAKLAVLQQTERRLKIANDLKAGDVLPKDEVSRAINAVVDTILVPVQQFMAELPREVAMQPSEEILKRCNARFAELINKVEQELKKL